MMQEESSSQGTESSSSEQQRPWWFKWLQKIACVIAALICAMLGLFACITLHAACLVAGLYQILLGVFVLLLEAPCCCSYLDFIDKISKFSDARPPYQKAIIYCILPIVPVVMCAEASTILGCVLIFGCGLSFAFVAIGRKASREEMLATARQDVQQSTSKTGLVDAPQPISQTEPPKAANTFPEMLPEKF